MDGLSCIKLSEDIWQRLWIIYIYLMVLGDLERSFLYFTWQWFLSKWPTFRCAHWPEDLSPWFFVRWPPLKEELEVNRSCDNTGWSKTLRCCSRFSDDGSVQSQKSLPLCVLILFFLFSCRKTSLFVCDSRSSQPNCQNTRKQLMSHYETSPDSFAYAFAGGWRAHILTKTPFSFPSASIVIYWGKKTPFWPLLLQEGKKNFHNWFQKNTEVHIGSSLWEQETEKNQFNKIKNNT